MTAWVHIPTDGGNLRTVGFYDPAGQWQPDSDHRDPEAAAARCHYLNGGNPAHDDLMKALTQIAGDGLHNAERIAIAQAALAKAGGANG